MKKISLLAFTSILLFFFFYALFMQKPTLHVFMWSGYIKPELITAFEQKYQCTVECDSFDSNEAMYTKLTLGGHGYDILFPSHYYLDLLVKHKLVEPIQKELLLNAHCIDHPFLERLGVQDSPYGIPFLLSFSGILYRSDRVNMRIDSWNSFSNPAFRGRMTLLNDVRETVGAALKTCGYSANTTDPAHLQEAKKLLLKWKKNIAKFESEQHKNGIASAEFLLVHAYANDCYQLLQDHPEVRFAFPKEGSLVSLDYISLCPDSEQKELAYRFIDFLLEPENTASTMLYTGGRAPHTEAKEYLPENLRASPLFYPETSSSIYLECLNSLGEKQKLYSSLWNQVRGHQR